MSGSVLTFYKGRITTATVCPKVPRVFFPINFLIKNRQLFLIKDINSCKKCEFCGTFFKVTHTCSTRRRDFFFHHINSQTSDWWETISFSPIGSIPQTKRLFIVYDVETYTWHGRFGKQLVPFLLVFKIFGDSNLANLAEEMAMEQNWISCKDHPHIFYTLSPEKRTVGLKFKTFRNTLQERITELFWRSVIAQNPHILQIAREKQLATIDDITYEDLKKIKIKGEPLFIELYIIGHNISGFDEVVLAAQVINNRQNILPCFKITRNFMPRNGRILFNDITYNLPNPSYSNKRNYTNWENGILTEADVKDQYVKIMVRDTFALTHASLKNAAGAYSLNTAKGHCPYGAVNDFYMTGSYLKDANGFPDEKYWKDSEEYSSNKRLWMDTKKGAYDIVEQTLDYCIIDVIVTTELVKKLYASYQLFVEQSVNLPNAHFNIFQRPTISSNSFAIFKQVLYRKQRPEQANLGTTLLAPSKEMYEYVRQSIRGGRCYPTYLGVMNQPIFVYDICGMYASALTHPFPAGAPLNPYERALAVREYELRLEKPNPISYFDSALLPGIFTVDADPPPETMLDVLPPFCSKKGGRLCWTNESLRGEVMTCLDVITLHNRGWKVRILADERTTIFPQWRCLAKEYVQLNIAAKEQANKDKNQTLRSIAKLLSNALYGSFATRLDTKKIVFSDQIPDPLKKQLANGEYTIKSSSYIETEDFCAEIMPQLVVAYPPEENTGQRRDDDCNEHDPCDPPFIVSQDHVTYSFKPITFLDVDEEDICLHTLEQSSPLIDNKRYPSHLASFVLAWTRAFVSEWCCILYDEDRGIPLQDRDIKSVYGDTDSFFMTERGHHLMETKGKHRLKKHGGSLVFDEQNPQLTWLVECETQCEKCKADAYSPETVFLAPKLYGIKETRCTVCNHVGKGKLRAKGHSVSQLSFETLVKCYLGDFQKSNEQFNTSRMSLKRNLVNNQAHTQPFTVSETTLTRTLRPWKDMTLHAIDAHRLIPYSNSNPNPRNKEVCWMEMPENG